MHVAKLRPNNDLGVWEAAFQGGVLEPGRYWPTSFSLTYPKRANQEFARLREFNTVARSMRKQWPGFAFEYEKPA